ncbi:hypothetical protein MAPG_11929, partial [Magnaporthiopsis poae ATCC 64411]
MSSGRQHPTRDRPQLDVFPRVGRLPFHLHGVASAAVRNLHPMASTTAQAAPGSGAKRGQACERCWKRKQKCDRLLPACTACADLGVECLVRAQDVDLVAGDIGLTHASIHSYMDALRRRVADLQQSRPAADAASPPRKRLRTDSSGRRGAESISMSPPDAAEGEDSSVRDTMGAIGFLSNSAMAEPTAGGAGEG